MSWPFPVGGVSTGLRISEISPNVSIGLVCITHGRFYFLLLGQSRKLEIKLRLGSSSKCISDRNQDLGNEIGICLLLFWGSKKMTIEWSRYKLLWFGWWMRCYMRGLDWVHWLEVELEAERFPRLNASPGFQVGSQAACKAWGTACFLWKPSVCSLRWESIRHWINAGRAGREVLQHRKLKHSLKQIKKMVINQMNFILEIIRLIYLEGK